jgi:hypothetical protein
MWKSFCSREKGSGGQVWRRRARILFPALLSLALPFLPLAAQQPPRASDEQSRLLEVRRHQIELSAARLKLTQAEALFKDGLVSRTELDQAKTAVDIAQLDYQVSLLSLLSLQPRVTLREAVKYETSDGRKFVRLTVANNSPTFDDSQFQLLSNFKGADPIPQALRTRNLRDVFISLRDTGGAGETGEGGQPGTMIAVPYEQHIRELRYGSSRTLTYQLLRDVESVTMSVTYMGQTENVGVQLQQATSESPIRVTATQISQEADLGAQANYELRLVRPSVDVRSFELMAFNLPREVSHNFVDPRTGARVSQINFPAGVTQQVLTLRLFLPEEAGGGALRIDQPVVFWAAAVEPGRAAALRGQPAAREQLQAERVGYVELTVTPRGVGRIEVAAPSLYTEISAGEEAGTELIIKNPGTRKLDTVRFTAEAPLGWQAEVTPARLADLGINREQRVALKVRPPEDVTAGEYEVRIRTESFAYNRPVPSEDKTFRVNVKSRVNFLGMTLMVALLLSIVIGVVVTGVKLTRR